jgi:hypothetical protein
MVGDQVTRKFAERRRQVAEDVGRTRRETGADFGSRRGQFDQLAPERIAAMVDGGEREGDRGLFHGVIDRSLFVHRRPLAEGDGLDARLRELLRVDRKPVRTGASILAIGEAADNPDFVLVFPLLGLRAEFGCAFR